MALRQAVWTHWSNWDPVAKTAKIAVGLPGGCADCWQRGDEQIFRDFGCGWRDDTRGRAMNCIPVGCWDERLSLDEQSEEARTCPHYFASQGWIQEIYALRVDYESGRLGNILDLPAPLVDYLRAAAAEFTTWSQEQERRIHDGASKSGN